LGGLSKKAYQIKTVRETQKQPVLVLDSGNLLFKKSTIPQGESRETITASGIIDAYDKMEYDAVAVGPLDLVAGTDFLKQQNNSRFPWISANLVDADNVPVFKSFIVKKTGQLKTGIIGLTHRAAFLPPDLHALDWQTILPTLVQKLSKECDHIILLSNLPGKENIDIAQSYPDIHIIISADLHFGNLTPVLNNNTLITQTSAQGQYLGVLSVEWGNSGRWEVDLEKELGVLNKRVDAIDRKIKNMENQKNSVPDITLQLEQAINDRQGVILQIDSLNQKTHEDGNKKLKPSTFTSNFTALKSSLPDSEDIGKILSGTKQQIRDMNRSSQNN
jgi:2',3'-cyclic-nucleotide 2'-phosphodiesterase (5'-nucleotidase family)